MTFISLHGATKTYGSLNAIDSLDLSIEKGEIVALLGSNGAGKSTTMKLMCGLIKPTRGIVTIGGLSFTHQATALRNMIGYLPEESAMYLDVGVIDYLEFFSRLYGVDQQTATNRIKTLLNNLKLSYANQKLGELSKGMRRKVLIARSLINDPSLLIYDEPASGLDPQTAAYILDFTKQLKKANKTIVFSSHNLGHVEDIADRVIIIHKGHKVIDAPLKELQKRTTKQFTIMYDEKGSITTITVGLKEFQEFMKKNSHKVVDVIAQQRSVQDIFLSSLHDEHQ